MNPEIIEKFINLEKKLLKIKIKRVFDKRLNELYFQKQKNYGERFEESSEKNKKDNLKITVAICELEVFKEKILDVIK